MVVADATGVRSLHPFEPERVDPRLCLFEFVYFARPDSQLYGRGVHAAQVRMGELLAAQAPVEADMVMGVPESGLPAAEGFARASGIPYGQGLVKNRYIGRTFIAPSQDQRALGVRMKLNPLGTTSPASDWSWWTTPIVQGTTQKTLVRMLREAGASQVPPHLVAPLQVALLLRHGHRHEGELVAADLTAEEIREYVNGRWPIWSLTA